MSKKIAIIGGGYTGLSAAHKLVEKGYQVTVYEKDAEVGGLAGSFETEGQRLEKFYHHWFTNDLWVNTLVDELGTADKVEFKKTRTGSYYANTLFRLSSPLDVLKYRPLSLFGRLRLGFLVVQVRLVRDWKKLESITALDWLRKLCGAEVVDKVWRPLLAGKFGDYAEQISAVFIWSKLRLRGGSRSSSGDEMLAYYRGGFAALSDDLARHIERSGGTIRCGCAVQDYLVEAGCVKGVSTADGDHAADLVIDTRPLPVVADSLQGRVQPDYVDGLRRIAHLGNICLVLQLDRSLSDTYWINVVDPDFPYVGIIEHTNMEDPELYGGRHIVYLSKYLPASAELYRLEDEKVFEFSVPHIRRMFPEFDSSWVRHYSVYRAEYSQPIIGLNYSELIPDVHTPLTGLYMSNMTQIYPEDRGTNYAIREGRKLAELVDSEVSAAG